jgi:hypothetical protein
MMTRHGLRLLIVVAVGVLGSGCRDVPTIWKAEIPSPDGAWLASARTEQNGGFGSASIVTGVNLKRTDGTVNSGQPFKVLDFDCYGSAPRAYVLDPANAGGTINLTMKWLTPSHLEVTYDGRANIILQVVKFAGVDISLRDLSKESATTSR